MTTFTFLECHIWQNSHFSAINFRGNFWIKSWFLHLWFLPHCEFLSAYSNCSFTAGGAKLADTDTSTVSAVSLKVFWWYHVFEFLAFFRLWGVPPIPSESGIPVRLHLLLLLETLPTQDSTWVGIKYPVDLKIQTEIRI